MKTPFIEFISSCPEETFQFGVHFSKQLAPYHTLCLHGALGCGKTIFSKGLISFLTDNDPETILSPTFNYMNEYEGSLPIFHFDLYRISSPEQFEKLGFCDYIHDQTALSIIEWPEKILKNLPQAACHIYIDYLDYNKRSIKAFRGQKL